MTIFFIIKLIIDFQHTKANGFWKVFLVGRKKKSFYQCANEANTFMSNTASKLMYIWVWELLR